MVAIREHPRLELNIIATASSILDRYGNVADLIEKDGFSINDRTYTLVEGETPITMAKSTGLGLIELASSFARIEPDLVFTVGDRFETMATTLAAAYMNIPIAHTMGGEVSGTIDESIRHAVTKFAHIHFPASEDAARRIIRLGEDERNVHRVGCPRIDLVRNILVGQKIRDSFVEMNEEGVGSNLRLDKPFIVLSQHPVTTEYGKGEEQILNSLNAIKRTGIQCVVLWPNSDAGSEDISRGIRKFREMNVSAPFRYYKNLTIEKYVRIMDNAACLVGNSSSGIREGAFIGTPVVNIGSRQDSRERGENVIDSIYDTDSIYNSIVKQFNHGKYATNSIYGDGYAGERIANIVSQYGTIDVQKTICY